MINDFNASIRNCTYLSRPPEDGIHDGWVLISKEDIEKIGWLKSAVLKEREHCALIALDHICTFGSMAEEIHATATAKAIAEHIRRET